MRYTSPFRCAVLWLLEQPYRWNAATVASITGQDLGRARAYCTHLVTDDVLKEDQDGCYTHSWAYIGWKDLIARSRPGGNSRTYLQAQAERADLYQEQHEARMNLGRQLAVLRGEISQRAVAELAQLNQSSLLRIEKGLIRAKVDTVQRILEAIEELKRERQAN